VLSDKSGLERTASGFILITLAGASHNSFKGRLSVRGFHLLDSAWMTGYSEITLGSFGLGRFGCVGLSCIALDQLTFLPDVKRSVVLRVLKVERS
jgi:hypothetical protein